MQFDLAFRDAAEEWRRSEFCEETGSKFDEEIERTPPPKQSTLSKGRFLIIIAKGWLYLIAFLILIGFVSALVNEGFWAAIASPFNDWSFLALIIALLPGFGLLELGKRLEERGKQSDV